MSHLPDHVATHIPAARGSSGPRVCDECGFTMALNAPLLNRGHATSCPHHLDNALKGTF